MVYKTNAIPERKCEIKITTETSNEWRRCCPVSSFFPVLSEYYLLARCRGCGSRYTSSSVAMESKGCRSCLFSALRYYYTQAKKKLVAFANKMENRYLQGWLRSILNHFWFSCSSCGESAEVMTPMYKECIKITKRHWNPVRWWSNSLVTSSLEMLYILYELKRRWVMDSMILFLDSVCVGQFAKKNRSESFVRSVSFPVAVNRIMECTVLSRVSQTQLLPHSHSQMMVQVGHQSTQHYNFNQTQRDGGV
jgi:hypothetical protein